MMKKNNVSKLLVKLIHIYQYVFNPVLGDCCRFYPSCSRYMEEAVIELGIVKAIGLTIKRLLKCHPFHPGGYDPVPSKKIR